MREPAHSVNEDVRPDLALQHAVALRFDLVCHTRGVVCELVRLALINALLEESKEA